jgi:glycosyltransferase involved in cell wall biosynthesis
VLPSRAEGFGLTVVEALATGVPVVASRIPSYRTIASDSPVRLVDFDRPAEVVAGIRSALSDWDARRAREVAGRFSWKHRGRDFLVLYESLVR